MTKILVLDDEPALLNEVEEWLLLEGFETVTASNGREGIQKIRDHRPDLVISDVTMPEMSGYALLECLQQEPELAATPFIFLTGHSDKSSMRAGMELGADDYLTKPITHREMLAAIQSRLKRREVITHEIQQEIDELKQRLIRTVNHELKTPLISLSYVQQVIERQLDQLSRDQVRDLLQALREGTNRLQHLVQQTVTLAQIDAGEISVETVKANSTPVYLWQIIPMATDNARRNAYRNREGVVTVDQRDPDVALAGDAKLLTQILSELIANALNFSPEGAEISITQWKSGGRVWLSILDRGSGMASVDLVKAQQLFEQIGRTVREQQGMGLGLVVAKRIVELHGGELQLGSVSDKGTQVTLSFPRHRG